MKIWNGGRKTSSNKLHDIPEITQLCVCCQMCCFQFLLEKSAKLQQTGKKKVALTEQQGACVRPGSCSFGGNYPSASAMPNLNSKHVTGLRSPPDTWAYSSAAHTLLKV